MQQRLERFSKTTANFTFAVGAAVGLTSPAWTKFVPQAPQTFIKGDKKTGELGVHFLSDSDFRFPIEGPAKSIATFGPGLTGSMFAGPLIGYTDKILFVSGGKGANFVNGWIDIGLQSMAIGIENFRKAGQLQRQLPPGVRAENAHVPEARYRNEGIAAAVGTLSAKTSVDIVIMSSVHTAGSVECAAGIEGASVHLRPGGLLVVKAPNVSLGNEAGMDQLTPLATNLFGAAVATGECGALQQHVDPSLSPERPASFAIYQR